MIWLQHLQFGLDSLHEKGKYSGKSLNFPYNRVIPPKTHVRWWCTWYKSATDSENTSSWGNWHHRTSSLGSFSPIFGGYMQMRYIMIEKNYQEDCIKIEGVFLLVWKVTILWKAVPVHCIQLLQFKTFIKRSYILWI